jgi:glycosyltransferase involved in cell wall biosynthesis
MKTVLDQRFSDFEYLVIGDCCTDDSEQIVRSFNDDRVRWTNLPENLGNQSNVNAYALAKARGELIAYLNHDDLWLPHHLETLVGVFDKLPTLNIVSSLSLNMNPPGYAECQLLGKPVVQKDSKTGAIGMQVYPMTSNVMHRLDAAQRAGGWKDWRSTSAIPTQDLWRRIIGLDNGRGISVAGEVTAIKFHSGQRLNSYLKREASEQESALQAIANDPGWLARKVAAAAMCDTLGVPVPTLKLPERPDEAPPGWQIEQWRRIRGLHKMLPLGDSEPVPNKERALPPPNPYLFSDGGTVIFNPGKHKIGNQKG